MNIFKKITAGVVCLSVLFTMCACHAKDETALTIEGVKITSALYASAFFECYNEAKSTVDTNKSSSSTVATSSDETSSTDYFSEKVDGQNFVDYVKAQTIVRCKEYAFYQKLVDDKTISLTDDEKKNAESYAEYYWNNQQSPYSIYYEPNGVSLDTYKKAFVYSYYSNAYFQKLYGEGGEKAVDKATISKTLSDKYVIADVLAGSYESDATDADKAALKTKYNAYLERLKNGEDFKKVYEEVNGAQQQDTSASTEETAKDTFAQVLGASDTSNYASDDFDTVKAMKLNDVKLVESSSGITIYVKKEITSDPYYLKTLNDSILYVLKQDEFDKLIKEKTTSLKVDENKFATGQFKVKKIKDPADTAAALSAQQ